MTFATHITGGISFLGLFTFLLPVIFFNFDNILITAIFAIIPDIDNPKSFIGRLLFFISEPLNRKFGHRTFLHSILANILFSGVFGVVCGIYLKDFSSAAPLFFSAFTGYFSHIILDALTKQGVLFYYPAKLWAVLPARASWRIRTGSKLELIYFAIFLLCFIFFISAKQQGLYNLFSNYFTYTGVEAKLKEFEQRKSSLTNGYNVDSLYIKKIIDKKEYLVLQNKIKTIDMEKEIYLQEQGVKTDKNK